MSSTRHAAHGQSLSQERYCSAPEFDQSLNAMPVAKRCEILADRELAQLIWFLQFRSQPARDGAGGRIGSVSRIAGELLAYAPRGPEEIWIEDYSTGGQAGGRLERQTPTEQDIVARWHSKLTAELFALTLDPGWAKRCLPGLPQWREALIAYRQKSTKAAQARLAQTSVAGLVWDCLSFTRETGKAVLLEGPPRTGKSETAKTFCECHPGLVRYVEVPSSNDEKSLYKAVAEALGVADGVSYSGQQIRERVEEVLRRSKLMLVFDEAQNLWPRRMRPTSVPSRVLWVMSLMNMSVPIAFVALPEFTDWMNVVADKTAWSKAQIEGRIARKRRLPEKLSETDLTNLAAHLLPGGADRSIKVLVNCARLHKAGAAVVTDAIASAKYLASKRGAGAPTFDDIKAAIEADWLPTQAPAAPGVQASRKVRAHPLQRGRTVLGERLQLAPEPSLFPVSRVIIPAAIGG